MKTTRIIFLLYPHCHLMDLAGAAQVFFEANALGQRRFDIRYATATGDGVQSAQGLAMDAVCRPEDLSPEPGDLVCVPGFDYSRFLAGELDAAIEKTKDWMWEQQKKGVFLGSVCSGALALGKMGLLDRVTCTSHWKCLPYMKEHFPGARVLENRLYVFDKGVFTSAGMTSGIDMALALVERWCSPLVAARVAQEMVINVRRAETREQKNIFLDFQNHFNPEVYKAQEILANRLDARFTLEDLARELNRSSRHLARLFKRHTGQTIQAYRDRLRLEHGEQLLLHTEMAVKEVAPQCGFESVRQFVRLWKQKKGCTPSQFRQAGQRVLV